MEKILERILANNRGYYKDGRVADYIPALKDADIKSCGISLIDNKNNIYRAGDYNEKFTIQSISKIVSLILAIMDVGENQVFKTVGYEGTIKSFNAIGYLGENRTVKAINPMMNSGAIAVTSLIDGRGNKKFDRILELVRLMAKNPSISLDEEVYISEKITGDRNRAIAYLMKSRGIIKGDVEEILDNYFKQCSIKVDTIDLANIAMSISSSFSEIDFPDKMDKTNLRKKIIAIMTHGGMYNFSGEWSSQVGIPSKSGVSGGILSVVPNRYGIGFYGPSLDKNGNPLVGYKVLKELSRELDLSIF